MMAHHMMAHHMIAHHMIAHHMIAHHMIAHHMIIYDGSSHDDSAVASAEGRSSLHVYRGLTQRPMCLQICHSRHMQYIQCTNLFRRGLLRDLGINEVVEVAGEALEGQV